MASSPKHVPRTGDRGHPNPRPPERPTAGSAPGNPGHGGPGGPKSMPDRTRDNDGRC